MMGPRPGCVASYLREQSDIRGLSGCRFGEARADAAAGRSPARGSAPEAVGNLRGYGGLVGRRIRARAGRDDELNDPRRGGAGVRSGDREARGPGVRRAAPLYQNPETSANTV